MIRYANSLTLTGALRGVSAVALLCFVKIGTGRMFTPGRRIYLFTVATFAKS